MTALASLGGFDVGLFLSFEGADCAIEFFPV
jgi:hypothetical protein